MNPEPESARARRYLLGQASEEECTALEQQYFGDEAAAEHMAATEDDLIEDYLFSRLDAGERNRFEREYLKSPRHQHRVEAVRHLMRVAAASRSTPPRTATISRAFSWPRIHRGQSLAVAAVLILAAAATLWVLGPARNDPRSVVENPPAPSSIVPNDSVAPPRVFAVSLSPVTVRSAAASREVIIPADTDVVRLDFEAGADSERLARARSSIRTVTGDEVWQGTATVSNLPPAVAAQLDVPAARLPADDYVVTLFGTDGTGAERERSRYFLRVRAR